MNKAEEKNFKKELQEILDHNSNYVSSYTGTPMFFSEKAIPKILALLKAKNFSSNPYVMGRSEQLFCHNCHTFHKNKKFDGYCSKSCWEGIEAK